MYWMSVKIIFHFYISTAPFRYILFSIKSNPKIDPVARLITQSEDTSTFLHYSSLAARLLEPSRKTAIKPLNPIKVKSIIYYAIPFAIKVIF